MLSLAVYRVHRPFFDAIPFFGRVVVGVANVVVNEVAGSLPYFGDGLSRDLEFDSQVLNARADEARCGLGEAFGLVPQPFPIALLVKHLRFDELIYRHSRRRWRGEGRGTTARSACEALS